MDTFDVSDKNSWYFGSMSRQDATEVLMNERERGVFLVRDSNSIVGDYVLCVREDTKVSNYIINKIQQQDQIVYRIGDQSFENLPKLLTFYILHYLDTTPLKRPAHKRVERVIGKFDFDGSDQDDLPFRRGEVLTIIRKDEDQWWTARNSTGQVGQIPVPYVQSYDDMIDDEGFDLHSGGGGGNARSPHAINSTTSTTTTNNTNISNNSSSNNTNTINTNNSSSSINNASDAPTVSSNQFCNTLKRTDLNRKLPAFARVKQSRVPNAYDKTALKLEIGDIIKVTKTNINGQWEGELKGRKGHFPFTHVEFVDDCDLDATTEPPTTTRLNTAINNDWGE